MSKLIKDHHLWTRNTIKNVTGDVTLDISGDITLDAGADVNIPANIGLTFGDDGEKIEGDGENLTITSSRHLSLMSGIDAGTIYLDSGTGIVNIRDEADANDLFRIAAAKDTGATTLSTLSEHDDGHLTIEPDGELILKSATAVQSNTPLKIREAANAVADTDTYGQIWVKNEDPEELWFTTGAGDDIQLTDGTSAAGGGGGSTTLKHYMDWFYYGANLSTQNTFYMEKWNDEYGVSNSINTDLSTSDYSTTTLNNAWRMIRGARRVPYSGTITKFMANLESTGAAADSDVEVALWWADALADDTAHTSTANLTCDHLCTITFDFSAAGRFMSKQTTSFNATAISEGDWIFVTLRKITSGADGSSFHCYSHVLWDGA